MIAMTFIVDPISKNIFVFKRQMIRSTLLSMELNKSKNCDLRGLEANKKIVNLSYICIYDMDH